MTILRSTSNRTVESTSGSDRKAIDRRDFLRLQLAAGACAAGVASGLWWPGRLWGASGPDLMVVEGDPGPATRAAVPMDAFLKMDPVIALGASLSARRWVQIGTVAVLLGGTAVAGRFFCVMVCPLGATIDGSDRLLLGPSTGKRKRRSARLTPGTSGVPIKPGGA
jgi:hypothetical protein